jgi:hypothetical protein
MVFIWNEMHQQWVGFEVLTGVAMKNYIFCNMSSSPLKVSRCFWGTCCLHFQGRRIGQARNQHEAGGKPPCHLLHTISLLGLFFDPEDRGDMFLRNVGWLSADCMALYPRRHNSSSAISLDWTGSMQGLVVDSSSDSNEPSCLRKFLNRSVSVDCRAAYAPGNLLG